MAYLCSDKKLNFVGKLNKQTAEVLIVVDIIILIGKSESEKFVV